MFEKRNPDREFIYKIADGVGLPMRVYMPEKSSDTAVLCIHGGGWKGAIKDNSSWDGSWMSNHAQYFSDLGYTGISISYRDLDLSEKLTVNDQIEDCLQALSFIKENFPYIKKVYAIGDSAGAHLALCLGFKAEALKPEKIAACNPVTDLTIEKWAYTGKTDEERKGFSPMFMVEDYNDENMPEILCMHGDKDAVVDINDTILFEKKLKNKGFKSEMVTISGATHAFILWGYTAKEDDVFYCMEKISEFFRR